MDLSKLSIDFVNGYQGKQLRDGNTQKNKILPYMTIVYPYKGGFQVGLGDDPLSDLAAGDGCFMTAPGARHTIVHRIFPGEQEMIPRWMLFTVKYDHVLDVTAWFSPPLLVTGAQAQPFRDAIDELNEIRVGLQEGTLDPNACAFRKLRVAGQVLENLLQVCRFRPVLPELERIYPAIALVNNHFQERLTVERMAAECAMSSATFYRVFRQTTGKTPMQYMDEYRLKQVARILLLEDQTLSMIAQRCGFCDEFHLSRNFKRFYGMSPRQYKQRGIV